MTPIPGTNEIGPKDRNNTSLNVPKMDPISVVNVKELKKPKVEEEVWDNSLWYNQEKNWILLGCIPSVIFALLAILNYRFLFVTPVGPYAAYLSFHIRKKYGGIAKKFDALS